jgi:MYXO-CTERM domain-containing protein
VLRSGSSLVAGLVVLLSSSSAFAQTATPAGPTGPAGGKDELTNLEKNLASESAALSTTDCTTACRALASIRRAADRICALDTGERCTSGRAKADEATKRVREACPECAIASAPPRPKPAPEREERAMTKGGTHPSADSASPVTASAPPSESKRGGCAGCATTPTSPGDLATAALAITALAVTLRRRKKRAS